MSLYYQNNFSRKILEKGGYHLRQTNFPIFLTNSQ